MVHLVELYLLGYIINLFNIYNETNIMQRIFMIISCSVMASIILSIFLTKLGLEMIYVGSIIGGIIGGLSGLYATKGKFKC